MAERWDPDRVRVVLEEIERRDPFADAQFGFDSLKPFFAQLQQAFAGLYLTSPVVYWIVLGALSGIALALAGHLGWSLWVLYRSMASSNPTETPTRDEARVLAAQADEALVAGNFRLAIELAWQCVCVRLGGTRSDTPRRQLKQLRLQGERREAASTLLRIRERASFSGAEPSVKDAQVALGLMQQLSKVAS